MQSAGEQRLTRARGLGERHWGIGLRAHFATTLGRHCLSDVDDVGQFCFRSVGANALVVVEMSACGIAGWREEKGLPALRWLGCSGRGLS
jgi:hypothetical protein